MIGLNGHVQQQQLVDARQPDSANRAGLAATARHHRCGGSLSAIAPTPFLWNEWCCRCWVSRRMEISLTHAGLDELKCVAAWACVPAARRGGECAPRGMHGWRAHWSSRCCWVGSAAWTGTSLRDSIAPRAWIVVATCSLASCSAASRCHLSSSSACASSRSES
jgi:hypothetical protein